MLLPVLLVLAIGSAGSETSSTAAATTDWLVLPILQYNGDTGLQYGVHFPIGRYANHALPYVWFIEAKLRHSTKNRHEHYLYLDLRHVLDVRLIVRADFLRIDDANFFGVANTSRVRDVEDRLYRYRLTEPRVQVLMTRAIQGPLFWNTGLIFNYTHTTIDDSARLAIDKPLGWNGGHGLVGLASLSYDTRDEELAPTRGVFLEAYAKAATRPLGSSFSFQGVGLTAQGYESPIDQLVLAQRFLLESLGGRVPFYELSRIGGRNHVFGLGGVFTQRGAPEARYIGQHKALSNTEVRYYLPRLFDRLRLGLGVFADVAWILDHPSHPVPSAGGEIAVQWKRLILFRIDYGISREGGLLYIEGRHLF